MIKKQETLKMNKVTLEMRRCSLDTKQVQLNINILLIREQVQCSYGEVSMT